MNITLSFTEENYLKAIFNLASKHENAVSTNEIANDLATKASSVTDMIKKLATKKLVDYKKYQGVSLTKKGHKRAVSIVRNHRLWEYFLVEKLDFKWDEVHELAEQLEHIKSDKLIDNLDAFLNYPTHDPHGDPIPDKDGNIVSKATQLLSQISENEYCTLVRVEDSSDNFLKYLDKKGIAIGKTIHVLTVEPYDNSIQLKINNTEILITAEVANNLLVSK